ncbi:hypothetical protein DRP04_13870 [Archaeoglobales archaeon]|nr:MAG: hypothetical protein DRP04_13870 [Archaeoglobales archaeon]
MEIPLVVDPNDYRWKLLREILNIFEMRKTKKIIARFTQIKTAINCMKITLTSMFFSTKISHVVEELKRRGSKRVSETKRGGSVKGKLRLRFPLQIRFKQLYGDDSANS